MEVRIKSGDETMLIYIASAKDGRVDVLKQGTHILATIIFLNWLIFRRYYPMIISLP